MPGVVRTVQVIGVARDLNYRGLGGNSSRLVVYSPLQQQYSAQVAVAARTTQGQGATRDIRAVVASINPNLPIVTTQTLEDRAQIRVRLAGLPGRSSPKGKRRLMSRVGIESILP